MFADGSWEHIELCARQWRHLARSWRSLYFILFILRRDLGRNWYDGRVPEVGAKDWWLVAIFIESELSHWLCSLLISDEACWGSVAFVSWDSCLTRRHQLRCLTNCDGFSLFGLFYLLSLAKNGRFSSQEALAVLAAISLATTCIQIRCLRTDWLCAAFQSRRHASTIINIAASTARMHYTFQRQLDNMRIKFRLRPRCSQTCRVALNNRASTSLSFIVVICLGSWNRASV